jgi:molybdopterin molybdotransferase
VISNWMLVGKGAVGGQMLTCLPYLERLRRRFGERLGVWPFDGIGDPGHDIVLAETWHGLFDWRADRAALRDKAQVRTTLRTLRGVGIEGRAGLLSPGSLTSLSPSVRLEIVGEEGWTLGIR